MLEVHLKLKNLSVLNVVIFLLKTVRSTEKILFSLSASFVAV